MTMTIVLTRDEHGRVVTVELTGVDGTDGGAITLPNVIAVQVTDRPLTWPTVGIEFSIGERLALVQRTDGA